MKKKTLPIFLLVLVLLLTACGSKTTTSTTPVAYQMSDETKLLVGTLKLQGTGQEVTAEQATELLPLWQMLQSLASSDTAALAEKDSVISQIKDAMTANQISAIDAMNLTQQDIFTTMQSLGLSMSNGTSGNSSTTTNQQNSMPSGGFPSGGAPSGGSNIGGGGMPSGGGMPNGGGQVPPDMGGGTGTGTNQMSSTPSAQGNQPTGNMIPTQLLDALIKYLETQAQP